MPLKLAGPQKRRGAIKGHGKLSATAFLDAELDCGQRHRPNKLRQPENVQPLPAGTEHSLVPKQQDTLEHSDDVEVSSGASSKCPAFEIEIANSTMVVNWPFRAAISFASPLRFAVSASE